MLILVIRRWYICHWYQIGIGKCVQWHDVSFQLETSETFFVGGWQAVVAGKFKWLNLFAATVFLIIDKSSVLRGKSRRAPHPLSYKLVLPTKRLPGRILKLLNYCLAIFHSRWRGVFCGSVTHFDLPSATVLLRSQLKFMSEINSICKSKSLVKNSIIKQSIRSFPRQLRAFIRFLCIHKGRHREMKLLVGVSTWDVFCGIFSIHWKYFFILTLGFA